MSSSSSSSITWVSVEDYGHPDASGYTVAGLKQIIFNPMIKEAIHCFMVIIFDVDTM